MKYTAPVAELITVESVNVLLTSEPEVATTACTCESNNCTSQTALCPYQTGIQTD